ncbi:unnamed protein product [Symbiodinium natans]|uniref:Uncharacterized protein n=1 Tax=Symbiodinium natans TaxID=878477 RepID=A0A812RX28_9DINO|nr:unnamed protein product [Symbiodinium natans]
MDPTPEEKAKLETICDVADWVKLPAAVRDVMTGCLGVEENWTKVHPRQIAAMESAEYDTCRHGVSDHSCEHGAMQFATQIVYVIWGAAAANSTESLTVQHNQVVSPRRSAVGLPFMRETVAFKIMTGTASYRHNFATKAEACFSFEPREDAEPVPRSPHLIGRQSSRWSLVAFEGNAAHDCLYGLRIPQELRQGNSQVFTDFTVFASQYAFYVRACDRCRLVNSVWVETTHGVHDEDSAPVVTDDPWIENVTAVGTRFFAQWATVDLGPQITLSPHEGRYLRNITFFLLGNSPCLYGGDHPVTIRVEKLRFYRSAVELYTAEPAGYGIFADLDGSFSGYVGGSVTGDKNYNRHSACTTVGTEALNLRLLCDSSIFIRPFHITGIEPAEIVGTDLTAWTIFGHGSVPYRDGWHMAVGGVMPNTLGECLDQSRVGEVPGSARLANQTVGRNRADPDRVAPGNVDFQKMRISFGSPGLMLATEWVGLHFPYSYSPVRLFESSGISGSCFEPYFDWLDRGGYSLWIPEVVFTSTMTSTTSSVTSTSSTSVSFTSTTTSQSTSSSTVTTTETDEDDFNDTNDTNDSCKEKVQAGGMRRPVLSQLHNLGDAVFYHFNNLPVDNNHFSDDHLPDLLNNNDNIPRIRVKVCDWRPLLPNRDTDEHINRDHDHHDDDHYQHLNHHSTGSALARPEYLP